MFEIFCNKLLKLKIHSKIYIAYSGGIDSSVLLHLLYKLSEKSNIKIKIIHLDYSHNKNYKDWNLFAKEQSNKYKIPFISFLLNSNNTSFNIEESFRIMRYKFFLKKIYKNKTLFIAHNSSDCLETIFINLFRGSGIHGVLSIKEKLKYKNLNIIRPLLIFNRLNIIDYAINNKINNIIDFSNFNIFFNRNFVRYKLYHLINNKWIGFEKSILRFSGIMNFIQFYLKNRYNFYFKKKNFKFNYLSIIYLQILPFFIRSEIIRIWLFLNNYKMPLYSHIIEINKIINSSTDSFIKISNFLIKKKKKNIYIIKNKKIDNFKKKIISNSIEYYYVFFNKNVLKYNIFFTYDLKYLYDYKISSIFKSNKFIFIISGFWKSKFYNYFLKNKIFYKILF